MLTPFIDTGAIDFASYRNLLEWYIGNGVDGLFAVCLSSELYQLTASERLELAKVAVDVARNRIPVVASAWLGSSEAEKLQSVFDMAATGVDAVVIPCCQLVAEDADETIFECAFRKLLAATDSIPLGLYECPAPYHRLLSPELLHRLTRLAKGRLLFLKDTSCDVEVIARKVDACRGTGLRVFNANTTTLLASLQAGADGYCGISANFYPEMLVEMFESFATRPERAEKLQQIFNLLQRHVEFKYPRYSKQFLHESGLAIRNCCRVERNPRFPNLLRPEAVELFLELTHDRYAARLGKYFGGLIRGIFTDEPSPGYAGNYIETGEGESRFYPWYPGVEDDYRAASGRTIEEGILPEFYYPLIGKRFRTVFFDRIRAWCDHHKLLFTGHLNAEGIAPEANRFNGDPLLAVTGLSLPGVDEIRTLVTPESIEWLTFGTARYGAERRKNGALAELFALGPADIPPAKLRQMISLAALFGIDHYVLAISPVDFRGNAEKERWFNPFTPDQPWFRVMGELTEDAAKAAVLARKKPAPGSFAIRYPVDGSDPGDLLRLLICEQYPWHLIAPEEAAGDEDREVITPSASEIRLERAGLMLDSLPALAELLHKRYPQSVTVVTPEGKKADSLLVREFADGSIAILDLTEQETGRRLLLRRNGGEIPFTLAGRERRFFPSAPPLSEVRVNRDRLNLVRPEWNEAGEFRFRVSAGISFRLYFRTGVAVRFDGSPVDAETPSPELGPGFGGLYRRSPEFSVAPGPHRLQLTGEPDRFCFLPALWIGGDFAFDAPALLGPERFDGSGLDHYAGTRIQTGFGEIPAAATGVELETDGMATEILLDGESLGIRLWPPFVWEIPERLRGCRREWRILRYGSIAPIFGGPELKERFPRCYVPQNTTMQHPVLQPHFIGV